MQMTPNYSYLFPRPLFPPQSRSFSLWSIKSLQPLISTPPTLLWCPSRLRSGPIPFHPVYHPIKSYNKVQARSQAWANPDTARVAGETARAAQLAFKEINFNITNGLLPLFWGYFHSCPLFLGRVMDFWLIVLSIVRYPRSE